MMKAWECPRCGRIYSEIMTECYHCNREITAEEKFKKHKSLHTQLQEEDKEIQEDKKLKNEVIAPLNKYTGEELQEMKRRAQELIDKFDFSKVNNISAFKKLDVLSQGERADAKEIIENLFGIDTSKLENGEHEVKTPFGTIKLKINRSSSEDSKDLSQRATQSTQSETEKLFKEFVARNK